MLKIVSSPDREHTADFGSTYGPGEIEAMQRAVIHLLSRWSVSDVDAATILGGIAPKTFRRWKEGHYGRVTRDLADRLSLLLGIHRALRLVFREPATGYRWMNSANTAFGGKTPVQILLRGGMDDIARIRRYLDSARGGW